MSVINQMLKDLEKRRAKEQSSFPAENTNSTPTGNINLSSPEIKPPKKTPSTNKKKKIIGSSIIILVILAIIIIPVVWFFSSKSEQAVKTSIKTKIQKIVHPIKTIKQQKAKKAKKAAVISSISRITPYKPIFLKNITAAQQDAFTTFTLNLSKTTHYQLHTDKAHQQLTLTLDDTELKQDLSAVSITGTTIKNLSSIMLHEDKDLQIILNVMPNTKVDTLNYNKQNTSQLILTLENNDIARIQQEAIQSVKKVEIPLTTKQKAIQNYKQALNALNQGNFDQTVTKLKTALKIAPNFIDARKALVILFIQNQMYQSANIYLLDGLKNMPNYIPYLELHARLLLKEGNAKQALFILQQNPPALAENPSYYALMAVTWQKLNRPELASKIYDRLLELQPHNSAWWMGLGLSLEIDNKPNLALQAYHRAINTGNLKPNVRAYVSGKIRLLEGGSGA